MINKLRDRTDLDRANESRKRLAETLKQRENTIQVLQTAIDKFKDKMIEYEAHEINHHEETVTLDKTGKLKI